MLRLRLLVLSATIAGLIPPAAAQDEALQPAETQQISPDALELARQAAARGDAAEALSRYLRILAIKPDDVTALIGAGRAALDVGDTNAAAGFFSRADVLDTRNGQVKAGLAGTMLANGNASAALRLFNEAISLGVPLAEVAGERGLAYDLRGSPKRAQADYALALRTHPDNETTRRLALSQAIGGDRDAALLTLDPLLRQQNVPAWRDRVFVYALTGGLVEAQRDAALVLRADQAAALAPYLPRLAGLKSADKAAAVYLGRFPGETKPEVRPAVIAAPKLKIDRETIVQPAAPTQSFAQVQAPIAAPPAAPPAEVKAAPTRAELAAQARQDARERAAEKRKADALAAAKAKREKEAEERQAARSNPARHWVQVAGGANKRDLGRAWDKLKDQWPKQLAGRSPWTTHYRFTNRLLIGPFATSAAAQTWVSERKKEGFGAFRVETRAGEVVERVD